MGCGNNLLSDRLPACFPRIGFINTSIHRNIKRRGRVVHIRVRCPDRYAANKLVCERTATYKIGLEYASTAQSSAGEDLRDGLFGRDVARSPLGRSSGSSVRRHRLF
ncbi:hypothetical protein EVAR_71430_1 [Eumeta japonica]|uniref:Uncharacterized protein n=1 Tax=Eumeta variegata TaxID=151549 RepID=A0A4C1SHW0_EUMVA|nr:hypothetical protein EVAR_71430_1 [Eumeta japonica]